MSMARTIGRLFARSFDKLRMGGLRMHRSDE